MDNQTKIDYLIGRIDYLNTMIDRYTLELNKCRKDLECVEAILDENSHLDKPRQLFRQEDKYVYLFGRCTYLEKLIARYTKDRDGCDRKINDLRGQMEEDLDLDK